MERDVRLQLSWTMRVRLYRLSPPWVKTVTVGQVTVKAFMELAVLFARRVEEVAKFLKRPLTEADLAGMFRESELCTIADRLCIGEPPRFLSAWLGPRWAPHGPAQLSRRLVARNIRTLKAAASELDDWDRFARCFNLAPGKDGKPARARGGAGMMGDVVTLSRLYGIGPEAVMAWTLEFFLNLCDAMLAQVDAAESDGRTGEGEESIPSMDEFLNLGSRSIN